MTDTNEKKLLLAPESYRYWAVNPTILFNYDSLIIDKKDVAAIKAAEKRSFFHSVVSNNVRFLIDEGMVQVEDYSDIIDDQVKSDITKQGNDLLEVIEDKDKKHFLENAYHHYRKYILSKSELLGDNPELNNSHHDMVCRLDQNIAQFKKIPDDEYLIDKLNDKVLLQYIWKILASLKVSKKMQVSFHDNAEYKLLTDRILFYTAQPGNECKLEDASRLSYLQYMYNLKFPEFVVLDSGSYSVFLKNKKDFENLKKLCKELDAIAENCASESVKHKLSRDARFLTKQIDEETDRLKMKHNGLWYPADVLASYGGKLVTDAVDAAQAPFTKKTASEAYQNIKKVYGEDHPWYFCFVDLYKDKDFTKIEQAIKKQYKKGTKSDNDEDWWLNNPDQLSWYVENPGDARHNQIK